MNDATREQQLETIFEKSSMAQKLVLKALAGLTVMMDSNLDRSVKFDGMKATVDMILTGAEFHALHTLRNCAKETQTPFEVTHAIMALRAIDDLQSRELRFSTIMMLFVDEAENRARDG